MYENIVAEYLEYELPNLVKRSYDELTLPAPAAHNRILSIIGVRRCGKTFFLYQLMNELRVAGVPRDRMLYFSFDDERIDTDDPSCASAILDAYYRLVPDARDGCYLFLDEIQEAAGWEAFARRVSEHNRVTLVLTGSSSKLLSTDIPTKLRGRSLVKRMWPLSFEEFCHFNGVDTASRNGTYSPCQSDAIARAFDKFLVAGGFPAVQNMTALDRTQMLQAYADQIVTKDVIERFGTVQYRVARRFARTALRSTGLKFSVNKQIKTMRSAGIKVASQSAYALLDDLEDAHLVFTVGDYNLSIRDNPKSSPKIYSVDPGLSLAVAPASHLDIGQRLETAVYIELKRRYGENRDGVIASYKDKDCPEVDFVVGDADLEEQYELLQVSESLGDQVGNAQERARYRREVGNLVTAMRNCALNKGTIITLDEEARVSVDAGTIDVVPAWKWLLDKRRAEEERTRLR